MVTAIVDKAGPEPELDLDLAQDIEFAFFRIETGLQILHSLTVLVRAQHQSNALCPELD